MLHQRLVILWLLADCHAIFQAANTCYRLAEPLFSHEDISSYIIFFFHLIFNLFLNLCSAKHFYLFFAVHYCNCLSVCVCVGHPGGRKVEVQFVDLGNRKILSVSDLRKIKDEFFALPARVRPQNFMYFFVF